MIHQTIYSSESTFPLQSDDLEELLEQARRNNAVHDISGALVYADGTFLQILEGEPSTVRALMARILKDLRHENVTILREGEVASAQFSSWKMAYVGATQEQVTRWAGIGAVAGAGSADAVSDEDRLRTDNFAQDILALLAPGK